MPRKNLATDPGAQEKNRRGSARSAIRRSKSRTARERMDAFVKYRNMGFTVGECCEKVNWSVNAYTQARYRDPEFKRRTDEATRKGLQGYDPPRCPFNEETKETYFAADYEGFDGPINPRHLRVAIDFINRLLPGQFGLMLFPPDHAKTDTGETWLNCAIADDPETRCVVISKTETEAVNRLLKVQARMEDPDFYADYIDTFGPFKPEARSHRPWSSKQFSVQRKTPRQRDYSLQAKGIGGQIQGKRIDKVLVDDPVDEENFSEYERQAHYFTWSVNSRLGKAGVGVMIGTRQDELDLYRYLMDEGFFDAVLIMPAQFEADFSYTLASGEVISWEAGEYLWPERFSAQDYENSRRKVGARMWALGYQQQDVVTEGQDFTLEMFEHCRDDRHKWQSVPPGCEVVMGIDPSVVNVTAGFVLGFDKSTKLTYLIDIQREMGLTGDGGDISLGLIQFIVGLAETYGAKRVGLEANSGFKLLAKDTRLRAMLAALDCRLTEVETRGAGQVIESLTVKSLSSYLTNRMLIIPGSGPKPPGYGEWVGQMTRWRQDQPKKVQKDLIKAFHAGMGTIEKFKKSSRGPVKVNDSHLPPYLRRQRRMVSLG